MDKYSMVISDGYGWKEVDVPNAIKKQGSSGLIMKDGGMKSILLFVGVDKTKDPNEMGNKFIKGIVKKGKCVVSGSSTIKISGRDVSVVEFVGKNPDGDDILGAGIITNDNGNAIVFTLYSGFVSPGQDEEMLTIVSSAINNFGK